MRRASGKTVARRVLFIVCHPVRESFCGALADRAAAGASSAGHDVRTIDLYADGFDPVVSLDEWRLYNRAAAVPASSAYVDDLRWCDTLVFVYPTWYGGQPAMLKGFLDRVLVGSFLLRNVRRLVVVTTHGSPKWLNAIQGEPGKRVLLRGVRARAHRLVRCQWLALYGNDRCDQRARADFLNRVEAQLLRI